MQVPSSSEGGDDRPTFFELVAADKLVPSLRAALVYSVGVLVSRRPSLARLLDHEDEAFALFMLLVEWHSFATSDGSLAEGLYGLQRTRARGSKLPRTEPASRPAPHSAARRMTKSQRIASVALLVAVPYARAKLDKLYAKLARARPRARHGRGRRRGRHPGRGRVRRGSKARRRREKPSRWDLCRAARRARRRRLGERVGGCLRGFRGIARDAAGVTRRVRAVHHGPVTAR